MKTHTDWFNEFSNHGYDQLSWQVVPLRAKDTAAIQADAQQGMVPVEKVDTLAEALKLVLLFHSGSPWTEEKKMHWANGLTAILGIASGRDPKLVGANQDGTWDRAIPTNEATTKNLCNAVRKALQTAKEWTNEIES